MFSDELEMLIDAAIADGEITEKKLAILHKRAMAEGVNLKNLDSIINLRLVLASDDDDEEENEDEDYDPDESTLQYLLEEIEDLNDDDVYDDEYDENGKIKSRASTQKRKAISEFIKNFRLPKERNDLKELIVYFKDQSRFFSNSRFWNEYSAKLKEAKEVVKNFFPDDEELLILTGLKEDPNKPKKKGFLSSLFKSK